MKLVALCGLHGAGKDTVADALPARKLAFADTLYLEVAEAWGLKPEGLKDRTWKEVEQGHLALDFCRDDGFANFICSPRNGLEMGLPRSPRQILQWWGDYRRAQDPDYFVKVARLNVLMVGAVNPKPVVLADCRFPNEAAMVRQLGGQIWQVVRPGHNPPCNGHASENDGSAFNPDVVITNNGTLDELRATALQEWNK